MLVCFLAVLFAACDDNKDDNKPSTYRVTFDTAGGGPAVASQSVKQGEKAQKPEADPAKSDSVFNVWVNAATDQAYNFADPVTEDLNLRATYAARLGITFNAEGLNNSKVERYHVVITKKGSDGAPDEVLEDIVLSEGFYNTKKIRSQAADNDSINLNIKAYKKPTPNTATLTAVPYPGDKGTDLDGEKYDFPPGITDADGRILAASVDLDLEGRELQKPLVFYFGKHFTDHPLSSDGKARGSLRMILDFTPFWTFLQKQNPPRGMQKDINIQRAPTNGGWTSLYIVDMSQMGAITIDSDMVEVHQPLDIAPDGSCQQCKVELTVSTLDAIPRYRFVFDDEKYQSSAIIAMPQPLYAGEKIDRTKAPLVFRNGTQELSGWPEPEDE